MRVLKGIVFVVVVAYFGGFIAFLLADACFPAEAKNLVFHEILGSVAFSIGCYASGALAYVYLRNKSKTRSRNPLTPEAERAARAKFQPTSSNESDNAIQHDKQRFKREDN